MANELNGNDVEDFGDYVMGLINDGLSDSEVFMYTEDLYGKDAGEFLVAFIRVTTRKHEED